MNIIFVGTSAFATSVLSTLLSHSQYRFSLVITRPDKLKGRGLKKGQSPVKIFAQKHGLKVFQPDDINSKSSRATIKYHLPDIIIVVAFGQKLGEKLLDLPHFSCINIHASLLPKYRGAAPIFHAIRNGETKTGVTIFKIVEKMDAGPILGAREIDILPAETAGELEERLAKIGAELLLDVLGGIEKGDIKELPQDESQVTYAPKITKADLVLDWRESARRIVNTIRALAPAPLAKTAISIGGKEVKLNIAAATVGQLENADAPGKIVEIRKDGLVVSAKDGGVVITKLQPESKRLMPAADFINGYRPKVGDLFI